MKLCFNQIESSNNLLKSSFNFFFLRFNLPQTKFYFLATMISNYRKKNKVPKLIIIHRLIPKRKDLSPAVFKSSIEKLVPIKNKANTIPFFPNQLIWLYVS